MANVLKEKASRRTSGAEIPLNGKTLTVWNDVGMGDAFQFVRYTLKLLQRGEKVRFAVESSQVPLFRDHLTWQLTEVVDRKACSPADKGPHIPLMSLIALLDRSTLWGRHFSQPTWKLPKRTNYTEEQVGLCWASNPQDRTMHAYKSCSPEQLLKLQLSDCFQNASQSACKPMNPTPISAFSCNQLDLIGKIL